MSIPLPKPLRIYQYRPLTVFSLMDTDTDRVLPQLFEMCVKGGRSSRSRTRPADFAGYRNAMLDGGFVRGFVSERDLALLDGWLRSCVVDMARSRGAKTGEQMLGVAPLTLAAYRSGLPAKRDRHRGLDDVVYGLLLAELERQGTTGSASVRAQLRELVTRTVGRGLTIGPEPRWEPQLAAPEKLDIGALLEFRFLEGFEMADARAIDGAAPDSPLPGVTADLGAMLIAHMRVYGNRLPVPSLMSGFAALMALGVFTFSLRADAAARELLRTGDCPHDMTPGRAPASPVELYCDFTGELGSESDRMSRRCVERDLDRVRLAFRDRMAFAVIEQALPRIPGAADRHAAMGSAEKLAHLVSLRDHRRVETYAMGRIDDIVAEATATGDATEPELEFLERVQASEESEVDKLLDILAHVNEARAVKNAVMWFWSVGGLEKPYGILRGSVRSRRSWRYAPTDELLTALLLALFVGPDGVTTRPTMPLREVLDGLRYRFGILIDRPPAFLDGAEARAAASANLDAFTLRLQLLGCFDSLSDDFSVQVVRHPLGDI